MAKIVLSVPGIQSVVLAGSRAQDSVMGASDDHTIAATRSGSQDFAGARATFSFIDGDGAATVLAGSGNETLFTTTNAGDYYKAGSGPIDNVFAATGNATLGGTAAFGTDLVNAGPGPDRVIGGSGIGTFVVMGGSVTLRDDFGATASSSGDSGAEYALSSTRISSGSTTVIQPDNTRFTFAGFGNSNTSPLA